MMPRFFRLTPILIVFSASLFAQRGDRGNEVQPPPPDVAVPPAPSLSVEDAMKTFKVAPGFHLEVVAAEPLVFDPIAMTFGPDGRLWVVEMRAFMPNVDGKGENEPIGSVSVLADTDGDGRMDKRTVFLDSLVMPRAISLVDGGLLVAEPTHLWYCRDTNGDGVADEKVEVANDYGNTVNPEHNANGLMWAMDNWIYSANFTARFRYEGNGKFARDATITRGQWGITQDDTGRLYYNSNSDPLRADLVPASYLKRNPNFAATGAGVQLVPATLRVWPGRVTTGINRGYKSLDEEGKMRAVTAACAPVIYRGTLFPKEFSGDAFICEPAGNLIKRIKLEENDGAVKGRNAYEGTEFLTSTDERFRPVNLINGPDGALYVVDMYRGVIQHSTYVTTYLRKQVEERHLERPVGMGRIYRIVPDGAPKADFKLTLATASTADLVKRLGDGMGWTRDTAQRLLVEKRDPAATPALKTFAANAENPLGRLHALWTLEGLGTADKPTVLRALGDADARVCVAGIRLAEKFLLPVTDEEVLARVTALAARPEPAVRLQLVLSLGDVHTAASDALLSQLLIAAPEQPYLADAIVSGLGGHEDIFVTELAVHAKTAVKPPSTAMSLATNAVLKSGDIARINHVLALVADEATPVWARQAVLDGVQRFLPKSPDGKIFVGQLPAEPKPLLALAAQKKNPDAERAEKLLSSLKWPGKVGATTAPLVELTPRQKALFEKGRDQFALVCAACHQPTGQGLAGLAPPLINSRWVLGDERVLARIVLCGKAQDNMIMPPMRAFDDETLAGVLTFIRRSWGHEAAPISPSVVAEARTAVAGRDEAWTDTDLEELAQDLAPAPARRRRPR